MFSARNLDLSEVSLNTSRELEAYIIIKTWIHEIYYRPLRYLWRKRVSSPTHWQWWVIDTDIQPGFTPVNWNADSSEYPIETWDVDKKVWEEYGFSGSSISLNVAVSEIRKAFKLLGRETAPIKTTAKVGFCFTAMIDIYPSPQITVNETPPSSTSEPLSPPRRLPALISRHRRRRQRLALLPLSAAYLFRCCSSRRSILLNRPINREKS